MSLWSRLRWTLRAKLEPSEIEAEIEEELRYHLEMRARDYERGGLSRDAAEAEARRRFGDLARVRSDCRRLARVPARARHEPTGKGDGTMKLWIGDLRYAVRSLIKAPVFSVVVLLTLTLGIGANSAIFSVVEGVLLRALPYAEPERLVMLWQNDRLRGTSQEGFSVPDYFDVLERADVFTDAAVLLTPAMTLTDLDAEPTQVRVATTSANLFEIAGVRPALGRLFLPEEDAPGGRGVVLLGHRIWQGRFGGSDDVIGRTIELDGDSREIVGVLPPRFRLPSAADLWVPGRFTPTSGDRGSHGYAVVARLRESESLERANAQLGAIAAALESEYADDNQGRGMWAQPLYESFVGPMRAPLLALLGAAGLVLLVACVNVANLLFARSLAREHETAIRAAIGAGRGALLRQHLCEGLLLSLGGGLLGLLAARQGLGAILSMMPEGLPRAENIHVNASVLGFTFALAVGTGLAFGLLPALTAGRAELVSSLRESGRRGASQGKHRLRRVLVTVEIALAVALVIGASLLIHSFWKLTRVDPGFSARNVVTVNVSLPASSYAQAREDWPRLPQVRNFQTELVRRARELPGAGTAAIALNKPLDPGWTSRFTVEGRAAVDPGEQDEVRVRVVSPEYFRTVGVRLIEGRGFEERDDRSDAAPVLVVNDAFARRYFDEGDVLGARVAQWGITREIVGVVENVRFRGLSQEAPPAIYPLFSQAPFSSFSLLVRTSDPELLVPRIRSMIHDLDPKLALSPFATLDRALVDSVAQERFTMLLFALFATVAILLAAVGIYGVMSYSVHERVHEIGVRLSLGARNTDVVRLVLGEGARLAGVGILLGVAVAVVLGRAIESLLFGIGRLDAVSFAAVTLLAGAVALIASYVPAVRASRVDPIVTLRQD